MDAKAYLEKQGWRGDGHSLDHTGKGIKRPLLVSKKVDVLGVGLNKHAAVNDQWWLRAFDEGLKNFGTGKKGILSTVQEHGIHRGGLYGRFVKGEGVAGTFSDSASTSTQSTPGTNTPVEAVKPEEKSESRKRKRTEESGENPTKLKRGYTVHLAEKRALKKEKKAIRKKEKEEKAEELRKERKKLQSTKKDKYASQKARREAKSATRIEALSAKPAHELTKQDKKLLAKVNSKEKETPKNAQQQKAPESPAAGEKAIKAPQQDQSAVIIPSLSAEKLAAYQQRAAQKGVPVEAYMQRRQEKRGDKRTEKAKKP